MEDLGPARGNWLSVDEPSAPPQGWYAVLRLHPDFTGCVQSGAAYYGPERWGRNHDIFARSNQTFAEPEAAEDFARRNSLTFGATVKHR